MFILLTQSLFKLNMWFTRVRSVCAVVCPLLSFTAVAYCHCFPAICLLNCSVGERRIEEEESSVVSPKFELTW